MNQFRKSLAKNQKINLNEAMVPDKEGTIILKNKKKLHLKAGDVVTVVDEKGESYENVTLQQVMDDKYEGLGGKIRFQHKNATRGFSGNALTSITVVK